MSGPYRTISDAPQKSEVSDWTEEGTESKTVSNSHLELSIVRASLTRTFPGRNKYSGDKTNESEEKIEYRFSIKKKRFERAPESGWVDGEEKSFSVTKEELETILNHLGSFKELKINLGS